jgi:hypothetical protein
MPEKFRGKFTLYFINKKNDIGKANGAPPVIPGSSGFDSHPEIF